MTKFVIIKSSNGEMEIYADIGTINSLVSALNPTSIVTPSCIICKINGIINCAMAVYDINNRGVKIINDKGEYLICKDDILNAKDILSKGRGV